MIPDRAQKLNAAGVAAIPLPGTVVPLPPPPSSGRRPTVEYAIKMSSGAMQVRNGHPEIERIFPLADWIKSQQRFGGRVHRRTVVVVEDWQEVSRG